MKKTLVLILISIFLGVFYVGAQAPANPVKWRINVKMTSATEGELIMIATIDAGWHLYGMNLPKGGPKSTDFDFSESKGIKFTGAVTPSVAPQTYHDSMFDMNLSCWENKVVFRRKFKVTNREVATVAGTIQFMSCNNTNCSAPAVEKFNKKIPLTK